MIAPRPCLWAGRLLDGFVIFGGCWTLYCWAVVFAAGSFQQLLRFAWIPCVLAVSCARLLPPRAEAAPESMSDWRTAPGELVRFGLPALIVVTAHAWFQNYLVFWLLALLFVAASSAVGRTRDRSAATQVPAGGGLALLGMCTVAVAITLLAHRPDADDSFYLSIVTTALDRPGEALLAHDGMFGEPGLPLFESWYRLKSYEPFVALLSRLTPLDYKVYYYLALPSLFAVLSVVAHWRALGILGGPFAAVGAGVVVAVLASWGDGHTAIGNFAFVRLFQGKATTVAVSVPAAVYYAAKFACTRDWRAWVLLCLCQIVAVGLSGSAAVAVPTTAIATLCGFFIAERRAGVWWGALASLVVGSMLFAVFLAMPHERGLSFAEQDPAGLMQATQAGLAKTLGEGGLRGEIALLALLLAPVLAPAYRRGSVIGYAAFLVAVVMNPLVPGYVGRAAGRLTWRIFWAVPFPLLLGLLGQRLAAMRGGRWGEWPGRILALGLVAIFAGANGGWTLSTANGTRLRWPTSKVPIEHAIAAAIVARTTPDDLVLAPYAVSAWVPTFRGHPRLVGVRDFYWGPLAPHGEKEIRVRGELVGLVSAPGEAPAASADVAVAEISARGVRVLVRRREASPLLLPVRLRAAGCTLEDDRDLALPAGTVAGAGYELWWCR